MNDWADETVDNENLPKTIVEKVSILSLLDKFKIEYSISAAGDFSHKLKCPLPNHSGGSERTASCYVSETTNKFRCYGCNNGGNVIDFIQLFLGKPYPETLRWLSSFAGITNSDVSNEVVEKVKKDPEQTVKIWVMRAGQEIRKFLEGKKAQKNYIKWCSWADARFDQLDEILNFPDKDWERAEKYYKKIKNYLENK